MANFQENSTSLIVESNKLVDKTYNLRAIVFASKNNIFTLDEIKELNYKMEQVLKSIDELNNFINLKNI